MTDLRTAAQQALEALLLCDSKDAGKAMAAITALRAALEQPEQAEPAACSNTFACRCPKHYTHPPRREWRGLTEEEIVAIFLLAPTQPAFARAIEAALKEKNYE